MCIDIIHKQRNRIKATPIDVPDILTNSALNAALKILKGSLDSIPSPSSSVKIQIMGRKVLLRYKGKTLLGVVNKLLKTKSLLTSPSNVLPYYLNKLSHQ